jgi:hypothetical protein
VGFRKEVVDLLSFDLDWVIDVVEIDVLDGYVTTPSLTAA